MAARTNNSNLIAGLLALTVAVLSALATWLNPNRTANLHRGASGRYHSTWARARRLHGSTCTRTGAGTTSTSASAPLFRCSRKSPPEDVRRFIPSR
jgi:hypothetical protein